MGRVGVGEVKTNLKARAMIKEREREREREREFQICAAEKSLQVKILSEALGKF